MPTRHREWQSRLAAVIDERMSAPFVWGKHDCCLFAADCVRAITGDDPAADARGQYTDEKEAAKVLRRLGGLARIAEQRCGAEVPPAMARIGDVVLGTLGRECLGVCTGETWHAPGELGLLAGSMADVKRAWRIG